MSRAFTESEIESIKLDLIKNCSFCWTKYGFRKTSVAELCKLSGISTGAFYSFFPSKEMLFSATADHYSHRIKKFFINNTKKSAGKEEFKKALKTAVREVSQFQWLFNFRDDYPELKRKLPEQFSYRETKHSIEFESILSNYKFDEKVSIGQVASIVYTLLMLPSYADIMAENFLDGIDFIIESVADKLF